MIPKDIENELDMLLRKLLIKYNNSASVVVLMWDHKDGDFTAFGNNCQVCAHSFLSQFITKMHLEHNHKIKVM